MTRKLGNKQKGKSQGAQGASEKVKQVPGENPGKKQGKTGENPGKKQGKTGGNPGKKMFPAGEMDGEMQQRCRETPMQAEVRGNAQTNGCQVEKLKQMNGEICKS